ncbi:MAG TPA: amidohydrolase family protein [Pseudonocardiaceae bacterium]
MIDAHHHLWDPEVREYGWLAGDVLAPIRRPYRPNDLRAKAAESGVDGTVLVQTVSDVDETVDFLAMADANRDLILGVVGWVDLTDPTVADTLAALRDKPGGDRLVGIRHQAQDEDDPAWLARPDVLRGLAAVAAAGLAYDLLVLPHQLAAALSAVSEVPQGRYVLDHAAKPPIASGEREPWATRIRELAAHSNLACKLSGLVTEANWTQWTIDDIRPYVEVVLAEFGPNRVLFGTDWPVCELASSYAGVTELARGLCAGLSEADRAAVFGGTAREWYRLA